MTRLAVCISGHVAKERVPGSIKEILAGYARAFSRYKACDYFLSLSYSNPSGRQIAESISEELEPKAYRLEEDSPIEQPVLFSVRPETNITNTLRMFSKIRDANNLKIAYAKEKGIFYSYAARSRPDMIFVKRVTIPLFLRLNLWDLMIPSFPWKYKEFPFAQTDWYALGRNSSMDQYANIQNHLGELVKAGILFHPETLLGNYLNAQGLRVFNIKSPCYFDPKNQIWNGYRG